jgi:hypothetical protein
MSELSRLLEEYHKLVRQLERLNERKSQLREEIRERVLRRESPASITVGDIEVRAFVRSATNVQYDEDALRQRLGNRYFSILDPDPKKIRQHLPELRPALEPLLEKIGSVSRERVAQQIKAGELSAQDFAGLYKKSEKHTLIVKLVPLDRNNAHDLP